MCYYTIRLVPDATRTYTTILPWGEYFYKRLPMDIIGSPNIFKSKTSNLISVLEYVKVYFDFE